MEDFPIPMQPCEFKGKMDSRQMFFDSKTLQSGNLKTRIEKL